MEGNHGGVGGPRQERISRFYNQCEDRQRRGADVRISRPGNVVGSPALIYRAAARVETFDRWRERVKGSFPSSGPGLIDTSVQPAARFGARARETDKESP